MCGRYAISSPGFREVAGFSIREWLESAWGPDGRFTPRFNIAPSQAAPVLRLARDGALSMDALRWGLVPPWGTPSTRAPINARCETVSTKPMFREAFSRRRCVVPATGFYEWQGARAPKMPWYIHPFDGQGFLFAGLWETGGDGTFTIVTTEANDALRDLHERMPVVLQPAQAERWLDPKTDREEVLRLLRPAADDAVSMHRISRRVNDVRNDDASLMERVEDEEEPREPTLFG
ncbi:MAG: SOS response-associated peptidase [Planctomycetota bacterium]